MPSPRDASPIEPMWEGVDAESGRGVLPDDTPKGPLGSVVRAAIGMTRSLAPHLYRWMAGMQPQLTLGWGSKEYHLRRDGWVAVRRNGKGWADNPRSNYNERLNNRDKKKRGTS